MQWFRICTLVDMPALICKLTLNRRFILLYFVTITILHPLLRFCDPTLRSPNEPFESQMLRNRVRVQKALHDSALLDPIKVFDTVNHYNANKTSNNHTRRTIKITVVTVSRNHNFSSEHQPRYLTQVVWQLLTQVHAARSFGFRYDIHLAICNVDNDSASHQEAREFSRFVPLFVRFDRNHTTVERIFEKEKQDYVFCLNRSLETDPAYVMLIEDDALPRSDFLQVLDITLSKHVENRWSRGEIIPVIEDLAYVKFFHPNHLLGFNSFGSDRLSDLAGLTAIFGTAVVLLYRTIFLNEKTSLLKIWIASFLYIALVLIYTGRPIMNEWRRILTPNFYSYTYAPSCCTPAMLFPRAGALKIIEYLSVVKCSRDYAKDSALEDLVSNHSMVSYLVQPNTFEHIGYISSLRVWWFHFES